jgi:polyisoprenyl-phosphate glycosyltransferase
VQGASVSIVIPCYKSEKSIGELHARIRSTFSGIDQPEIILVCDASPDDTWQEIGKIVERDSWTKGFMLGKNVGQQVATKFGVSKATGNFIITMDDDLQHDPKVLPELIGHLKSGSDLVYAVSQPPKRNRSRYLLAKLVKSLMEKTRVMQNASKISAFRGFRRNIVPRGFYSLDLNSMSIDLQLSWKAKRVSVVTTDYQERMYGKSNYSLRELSSYSFNLFLKSSELPMKAVNTIGLTGFALSSLLLIWSVINYFIGNIKLPGYFSLIVFLTLMSSLQFLILGILGRVIFEKYLNDYGRSEIWIREILNE